MSSAQGPAVPVVLEAVALAKRYDEGPATVEVLRQVDLAVAAGERLAVIGASGSGKSTLLHLLGGLDRASGGEVRWDGVALGTLGDAELGRRRNLRIGFVYQFHHLLPELTALENVALPLLVRREPVAAALGAARALLERVGLGARLEHKPSELSGGERQRAAVARALVSRPGIVLADEPTGNLDARNGAGVFELMLELNRELGTALLVVTHDAALARRLDRVLELKDGGLRPAVGA